MQAWTPDNVKIEMIGHTPYADADTDGYDGAYRVIGDRRGSGGVAWRVFGWEVEPTEDTEWDGIMIKTGRLVCVMIGDDRPEVFDVDDIEPIERADFCGECGQIGCTHDGLDRDE